MRTHNQPARLTNSDPHSPLNPQSCDFLCAALDELVRARALRRETLAGTGDATPAELDGDFAVPRGAALAAARTLFRGAHPAQQARVLEAVVALPAAGGGLGGVGSCGGESAGAAEAGAAGAGPGADTYVALDALLPALVIFFALETLDWEVSCVPCAEQVMACALVQLQSCGRT